jgi:hypothetical protein
MFKFIAGVLYTTCLIPLYLQWSQTQVEEQINRMQEAVFNSPGMESPITPSIVVGGITLLTSHMVIARRVLQLSQFQAFSSMLLGGALGFLGWQQWQKQAQRGTR